MSARKSSTLRSSDLPGAMELSRSAGWNQTIEDWEMLLRLDPQGCFAIELDDRIVATTTLLCYGATTGLDRDGADQAGVSAHGLCAGDSCRAALDRAAELKIESIKLDATPQGQPLYEKLGFQTEQIIERWFCDQPSKKMSTLHRTLSRIPPSRGNGSRSIRRRSRSHSRRT